MQEELTDFINAHTRPGSMSANVFVTAFLQATRRLLTHEARLECRAWLDQLGLLLCDGPPPSVDRNTLVVGPGGHAGLAIAPGTPLSAFGGKVLREIVP